MIPRARHKTTNAAIARMLREMAVCYEMDGVQFKPQAYVRAAEGLEQADAEAAVLFATGGRKALRAISGIGEGISLHIERLLKTGSFPEYRACKRRYPIDALGLTAIDEIGPKRAKSLFTTLNVRTVADLRRAARAGTLDSMPGFGEKIAKNVLQGVKRAAASHDRTLLGDALPVAEQLVADLRRVPGVRHAEVAGSIRRRQETIGDMDLIVTTAAPEKVMEAFAKFPAVARVLEHGPTMTVVRLRNGMRADVRVVPDESFGAAMQYFTGDKNHNVAVRKLAIAKGLMLNEYGIWRLPAGGKGGKKRLASRTEEEVYRVLGLDLMPPEIRTESGEIEAARAGKLPKLLPYGAVRGDLQVQSDWTDGRASIAAMAKEARRLGREYIAITDHTRTLAMTGGLDEKGQARQGKEIDALNAAIARESKRSGGGAPFTILKGAEVNILRDGSVDINDAALAKLDVVGIAVHSHFHLSREEQTKRVITALRHPHTDILFHPTGRKIFKRDPIDLDMEAVLRAAKEEGVAMEIDSYPDRSDLRDVHVRMAVAMGVKLVIDTDAHHPSHLGWIPLGEAIARRGWARKADVLNTRPLAQLRKWLETPKKKR